MRLFVSERIHCDRDGLMRVVVEYLRNEAVHLTPIHFATALSSCQRCFHAPQAIAISMIRNRSSCLATRASSLVCISASSLACILVLSLSRLHLTRALFFNFILVSWVSASSIQRLISRHVPRQQMSQATHPLGSQKRFSSKRHVQLPRVQMKRYKQRQGEREVERGAHSRIAGVRQGGRP
jgi:hypothetical protein